MSQNEALVILGMHRSGTSAMAGVATALGAAPPNDLLPAQPDNPKGFWESEAVMRLNDHVLATVGSTWSDWRAINPAAFSSAPVRSLTDRAAEVINTSFSGEPLIVLKDPRVSRLLPFWRQALRARDYVLRSVVMVRSPMEVAASLQKRESFSLELGMLLWLRYSLDAELQSRGLPRSVVLWSDLHANWRREVARISAQTGVNWPDLSDAGGASIDDFLSEELYHHRSRDTDLSSDPRVHLLVVRAYTALSELARQPQTNAVITELDEVRRAFDDSSRLFGPLLARKDIQLAQSEAKRSAAAQQVADQTSLLITAQAALTGTELRLQELETTAAQDRATQISLRDEAELARSEAETRLQSLLAADAEVVGELARRNHELEAAHVAITSLTTDLAALNELQSGTAVELDDMRLRGAALEDELARVTRERDGGAENIAHLERALTNAACETSTLRSRIDALTQEVGDAIQLRNDEAARNRGLERQIDTMEAQAGEQAIAAQELSAQLSFMKAEMKRASEAHSAAERDLADQRWQTEQAGMLLVELRESAASEQRGWALDREHADSQLNALKLQSAQLEEGKLQAELESRVHEVRAAAAVRRLATLEAGWLFRLQRRLQGRKRVVSA